MIDTDELMATVRKALGTSQAYKPESKQAKGHVALDALAAELERLRAETLLEARNYWLPQRNQWRERARRAERELERVRAERDEAKRVLDEQWPNLLGGLRRDRDKALAALREIEQADPGRMSHTLGVFQDIARAAIAEIEGRYDDIPSAGQRGC